MVADDPFGQALKDLDRVLDVNLERLGQIKRRIAEIQRQHSEGLSYTEIVEAAPPPLLVQLVTESKQMLDGLGGRVRRAEALALHKEGMTMEVIAERFGVTRQRVSALLEKLAENRQIPSGFGWRARRETPSMPWPSPRSPATSQAQYLRGKHALELASGLRFRADSLGRRKQRQLQRSRGREASDGSADQELGDDKAFELLTSVGLDPVQQ